MIKDINFGNYFLNVHMMMQKFFEVKEYKKGLKHSKKLLEQNPNLAGKLIYSEYTSNNHNNLFQRAWLCMQFSFISLDQRLKVLIYPKRYKNILMLVIFILITITHQALMKNLKSEIAWHIYGHINRSNKNLQEAINCYKKAHDITPKSIEILRDLAQLQVQIRDVEGLCETRRKILVNQDSVIINWVGYAFSLHLKGDNEEALKVIDSINNITKNNPLTGVEKSEVNINDN